MQKFNSELIIVGAGPGDPELITLKALKALKKADVILYDNLANKELLQYSKENCEMIYVGKNPYQKYNTQEQIHELIAIHLGQKEFVIRLKGGDPFIFGRGMEEVMFARSLGYKASYIPGITSMLAIGLNDIPLTHRGISESLWMITGTKKDGSLSRDVCLAMQSKTTLVIYMGMKNLPFIIQEAIKCGKPDTPAALIQHASLPNMKMVKGRLIDLEKLAKEHEISHPALIVIGEVVAFSSWKNI
ncbi:uroporphyrin-III C-methyltransferase [Pedobacter sp. UYP30]|uniref:uroporphyrinogen-III C-methyltransferase n=1 Tax=Pedobacter sp. UYP30 TaxID=1756400 RepID=UPI0033914317